MLEASSGKTYPYINSKLYEGYPEFSPDGNWLAYVSGRMGQLEVWVQRFPGPGERHKISTQGGLSPLWSRNMRELYYVDSARNILKVEISVNPLFKASIPRTVVPGKYVMAMPLRNYDTVDGQRFLLVQEEKQNPRPVKEFILVQNWFEELKRLCPAGK